MGPLGVGGGGVVGVVGAGVVVDVPDVAVAAEAVEPEPPLLVPLLQPAAPSARARVVSAPKAIVPSSLTATSRFPAGSSREPRAVVHRRG